MRKNHKFLLYLFFLVCLFSCKQPTIEYIDPSVFPDLFSLKITSRLFNGHAGHSYSTSVNSYMGGEVANFVKAYPYRFEYIVANVLGSSLSRQIVTDSITTKNNFKEYLLSQNFYKQFSLLVNSAKNNETSNLVFSKKKYFHTGSLFFICDEINKKDTSINYHICVGINGISDADKTNEKLALQALCFEAIFKNTKSAKSPLLQSFHSHITKATNKERKHFVDYNTFHQNVKQACFKAMEEDENFQTTLMNYYTKNRKSLNFIIR